MKAPSAFFRIERIACNDWIIVDDLPRQRGEESKVVWSGKTFKGARTAHYRLAVARITGKPVSYAQARRAGNA